jgi:hypothetical protein
MTYFSDNAPRVSATVITLAVIAYVVFGLRVHTRLRNRAWGMDDWCMTAAIVSELLYRNTRSSGLTGQIPFSALTISCLGGSFSGIGVHESRLTAAEKIEGLKVCEAKAFHITRPKWNLTGVVFLLL